MGAAERFVSTKGRDRQFLFIIMVIGVRPYMKSYIYTFSCYQFQNVKNLSDCLLKMLTKVKV